VGAMAVVVVGVSPVIHLIPAPRRPGQRPDLSGREPGGKAAQCVIPALLHGEGSGGPLQGGQGLIRDRGLHPDDRIEPGIRSRTRQMLLQAVADAVAAGIHIGGELRLRLVALPLLRRRCRHGQGHHQKPSCQPRPPSLQRRPPPPGLSPPCYSRTRKGEPAIHGRLTFATWVHRRWGNPPAGGDLPEESGVTRHRTVHYLTLERSGGNPPGHGRFGTGGLRK
jgi:hypothetical protein